MDTDLRHLALATDWSEALERGVYEVSTRGTTLSQQGFIHLSFPHQLAGVAAAWYRDAGPLVVLDIDRALLIAPVVLEPSGPESELFPHLYGPLPTTAVARVHPAGFDAGGRFVIERA